MSTPFDRIAYIGNQLDHMLGKTSSEDWKRREMLHIEYLGSMRHALYELAEDAGHIDWTWDERWATEVECYFDPCENKLEDRSSVDGTFERMKERMLQGLPPWEEEC